MADEEGSSVIVRKEEYSKIFGFMKRMKMRVESFLNLESDPFLGTIWILFGSGSLYLKNDLEDIIEYHPTDRVIIFSEEKIKDGRIKNV